jgi:hypothetical protein
MPRKPQVRSRRSARPAGASASFARPSRSTSRPPAARRRAEPLTFQQCQACGAPVEPQFGLGDDSWCPSCQAVGTVAGMYGQYPSPGLYGAWAARQARQKETQAEPTTVRHPSLTTKEELMKRTKTHAGTFHCPTCFIEVELVNEESLKCDRCKGPLAEGSLDEVWADEDEEQD